MMRREAYLGKSVRVGRWLGLGAFLICLTISVLAWAAPQQGSDIPPDATPEIQQINPSQAAAGTHLTVTIQGNGFSSGAYVSSVLPAVHVDSSKRISATKLEAEISVSASAQPSTISLLVSNPASTAAETNFKITPQESTPAPPGPTQPTAPQAPTTSAAPGTPGTPSTPATPSVPAQPSAPASPATPTAPSAPAAPPAPVVPAGPPVPEVSTVVPASLERGADIDVKIIGKNFAQGAKVSFANTGIRVFEITSPSAGELDVHVKVAPDAPLGAGSLFVVNPDDSEVEVPFGVIGKGGVLPPAPPIAGPTPSGPAVPVPTAPGAPVGERYDAYHLGSPSEVFHTRGRVKGQLVVASGTLQYQEDGKTLINITLSDIKEIKTSSIATATFHVTLSTGETYHFAPGSLRPSDARNLVDSLRKDLPH